MLHLFYDSWFCRLKCLFKIFRRVKKTESKRENKKKCRKIYKGTKVVNNHYTEKNISCPKSCPTVFFLYVVSAGDTLKNWIKVMSYAHSLLVCQEKSLLFSNSVKAVWRVRLYSILGICGGLYDTGKEMETETTVERKTALMRPSNTGQRRLFSVMGGSIIRRCV